MTYERHRFKTDPHDYRPVNFPPPGPYWCTGYSCNPEHSVVVAYLPKGEPLADWWPDACAVETEEVEEIQFTSRFPRPSWYDGPPNSGVPG